MADENAKMRHENALARMGLECIDLSKHRLNRFHVEPTENGWDVEIVWLGEPYNRYMKTSIPQGVSPYYLLRWLEDIVDKIKYVPTDDPAVAAKRLRAIADTLEAPA